MPQFDALLLINRVMKEPINNGDVVLSWRIKASEEARRCFYWILGFLMEAGWWISSRILPVSVSSWMSIKLQIKPIDRYISVVCWCSAGWRQEDSNDCNLGWSVILNLHVLKEWSNTGREASHVSFLFVSNEWQEKLLSAFVAAACSNLQKKKKGAGRGGHVCVRGHHAKVHPAAVMELSGKFDLQACVSTQVERRAAMT